MESKTFIDRIEYYMDNPNDEEYFNAMFTAEEKDILHVIKDFEQNRYMMRMEEMNSSDRGRVAEEVLRSMEHEKKISFLLQGRIHVHMDSLLEKESVDAWMEILAWYQLLDGKGIIVNRFYEFPILKTMLHAFTEELKLYYSKGKPFSVLLIHSMEEMMDIYFRIVFLLRRIEYEIEPIEDILYELSERKISPTAVKVILADARIFHQEKVRKVIEGWEGKLNG